MMRLLFAFTDEEFNEYRKLSGLCFSDIYELLKDKYTKSELHNILNGLIIDIEKRHEVARIFIVNRFARNDETLNNDLKEMYKVFVRFGMNYKDIANSFCVSEIQAYRYITNPVVYAKSKKLRIEILDFMRAELRKLGVLV